MIIDHVPIEVARETGAKIVLSSDWRASNFFKIRFGVERWTFWAFVTAFLNHQLPQTHGKNEHVCLWVSKIVSFLVFDSCHLAACILRMLMCNCLDRETPSRFLHMTGGVMDHEISRCISYWTRDISSQR